MAADDGQRTVHIAARVPEELAELLAARAKFEDVPASSIVRRALRIHLMPTAPRPNPFTSPSSASGQGSGGLLGDGLAALAGSVSMRGPT